MYMQQLYLSSVQQPHRTGATNTVGWQAKRAKRTQVLALGNMTFGAETVRPIVAPGLFTCHASACVTALGKVLIAA